MNLFQEGHEVSVKLKIGQMSCIEFAAMRGLPGILSALLDDSINANTLKQYFSLAGMLVQYNCIVWFMAIHMHTYIHTCLDTYSTHIHRAPPWSSC